MKHFFYLIYFLIVLPELYSYITFPLLQNIPSLSIDEKPSEVMKKLFNSNLYIIINIGSENIEVKTYLSNERYELMIAGNKIKNHKYNENNSASYNCTYCKVKEFSYGKYDKGIISTENFSIKFNEKETKVIKNMNFILGTNSIYIDPPEAFVGLILPYFDSELNYNLFTSLKITNSTSSYIWYLNFTEKNSKMVIDAFPHNLENTLYNVSNLDKFNAVNDGYYLIWGFEFTNVYYDNEQNNISYTSNTVSKIDFSLNYILAPNNTGIYFENIFFDEYFKKNICFKEGINDNKQYFIYCLNSKDFDPKKFKNIYFKTTSINTRFELNYEDLFLYQNNYIYFLILFQSGISWSFGELFLKKFMIVFDHDNKVLYTYKNYDNENKGSDSPDNKDFDYINILYICLLVLILVGIIAILVVLIKKRKDRKKRANEMKDDDYIYEEDKLEKIINNNGDKSNSILPN